MNSFSEFNRKMLNVSNKDKIRKIGSSVGNLSISSSHNSSTALSIQRSQSLLSLKDSTLSNTLAEWQNEPSKVDITKASEVYKKYESSTLELAQNKFILECLREIAENSDRKLSENTAKKMNDIIKNWDCQRYLKLSSGADDPNKQLLGILNLPGRELTEMEKKSVSNCLEMKLKEKINGITEMYKQAGFDVDKEIKSAEDEVQERFNKNCGLEQDSMIGKIVELLQNYQELITTSAEQLDLWKSLQKQRKNAHLEKSEHLKILAKLTELKSKITVLMSTIQMCTEKTVTLESFQKLNSMLDDEINVIDLEIQKKKELKKQYEALKGTEFDVIVKKYRECCINIEKKKNLLDMMGN